jgi:hypothetical protein
MISLAVIWSVAVLFSKLFDMRINLAIHKTC